MLEIVLLEKFVGDFMRGDSAISRPHTLGEFTKRPVCDEFVAGDFADFFSIRPVVYGKAVGAFRTCKRKVLPCNGLGNEIKQRLERRKDNGRCNRLDKVSSVHGEIIA